MRKLTKTFLSVVPMALLLGCANPPTSTVKFDENTQSQSSGSSRFNGRSTIERVAVVYLRSQNSEFQDDLVTKIANGFFERSIGYTTSSLGGEISYINLGSYLKRFQPTHVLQVFVLPLKKDENFLAGNSVYLRLVDMRDSHLAWEHRSEISNDVVVRDFVALVFSEMEKAGVAGVRVR